MSLISSLETLTWHDRHFGLPPYKAGGIWDRMVLMTDSTKATNVAASEAQLLLELVAAIRAVLMSGDLQVGEQILLRCPCGRVILPPMLVHENIKDRQRGMLKAKVERHLREDHGVSRYSIAQVLKDSFATSRVAHR